MKPQTLDKRDQEILEAIVDSYVETGEPVGSGTIARRSREGLSPATIRNVMANLEERDLISQPHTSAGRVPTDLGYRVYVDSLMRARPLRPAEQRLIESSFQDQRPEFSELLSSVSRILSRFSKHMGVVVSPHIARAHVRDIEFVRLAKSHLLVIVVAVSGMIYNKVVQIEEDFPQEKLDWIGRYLTSTFKGRTLPEIRDRILEMMGQEKALYDELLSDALKVGSAGLGEADNEEEAGAEVFVDGTSNLLSEPEFARVERLRTLFRTFEEKHELLRVLNSCLERQASGVRVIIGSENPSPEMSDCTLITSNYAMEGETLGTLGIIGPTRMEYARAIALVDSVARLFSAALRRYPG